MIHRMNHSRIKHYEMENKNFVKKYFKVFQNVVGKLSMTMKTIKWKNRVQLN